MELGARWAAQGVITASREFADPGRARRLLVASGSCSPVTARQIEWALSHGFAEVPLDAVALTATARCRTESVLREASDAAVGHLSAGRHVIVHTTRSGADPRVAEKSAARVLGEALGAVVRAAASRTDVRRVLIAGGDTSGYLARALGVEALEMIAPLTPGAPLCRAHAASAPIDGLELNFKGGQVGGADYFQTVADGRSVS
jgi:uncharacterized protein YgbK (DUF1537 family)